MFKRVISFLLTGVGVMLISGGALLGHLATKRMGVLRSLYYRNMILENTLLSTLGESLIVIALAVAYGVFYKHRIKSSHASSKGDIGPALLINSLTFVAYAYYKMSAFMGAPWILLGMISVSCVFLIKKI